MFPSPKPMPRTAAGLRTEDRLPRASESVDPDWRKWIELVELAVAEAQQSAWSEAVAVREQRPIDAPLLHCASLRVPAARASTYTARLAAQLGIVTSEAVDPIALIRAGIERDPKRIEKLAGDLAVPADTVALLGQLSAMPLLLNAARTLSPESTRTWQRGYCPVCGAWPAMVEMRGIQRERRMRCGCCSSDWLLPVLRCAFCEEVHHQKLGSFANEGEEHLVRVETCASCHGYLKSVTTLGALPFTALAMKDLSTVTFDLAASDRGYARPARPGWQLVVEMVQ
jgi:FdhE protein